MSTKRPLPRGGERRRQQLQRTSGMPDGVDAAPDVLVIGCGYGRRGMLEVLLAANWQLFA